MKKGLLKNLLAGVTVTPNGLKIIYTLPIEQAPVIQNASEINGPNSLSSIVDLANYKREKQLTAAEDKKRTAGSKTREFYKMVGQVGLEPTILRL